MAGNRKKDPELMKEICSFVEDYYFEYAQGKKDAKWFGCLGKTEEKLAFLLALAMH